MKHRDRYSFFDREELLEKVREAHLLSTFFMPYFYLIIKILLIQQGVQI